jgi:hypothetical protein
MLAKENRKASLLGPAPSLTPLRGMFMFSTVAIFQQPKFRPRNSNGPDFDMWPAGHKKSKADFLNDFLEKGRLFCFQIFVHSR